jgi:hypothetical protein
MDQITNTDTLATAMSRLSKAVYDEKKPVKDEAFKRSVNKLYDLCVDKCYKCANAGLFEATQYTRYGGIQTEICNAVKVRLQENGFDVDVKTYGESRFDTQFNISWPKM